MTHLMIDLETLSTSPTAAVAQLGWCLFDPERGERNLGSGCVHLDLDVQIKDGYAVDWSTVAWWLRQDDAARLRLADNVVGRHLPSAALAVLDERVFDRHPVDGVWSHGATFDLVIMENLYRRAARKPPWGYRDTRDTRTLFWTAERLGLKVEWPPNPVKHSAEHDAVCQAGAVVDAFERIEAEVMAGRSVSLRERRT